MKKNNKKYTLSQLAAIYNVYKDLNPSTRIVNCCTCGKSLTVLSPEDAYCYWGHFIPRSLNRNLIYYPKNSHAQCTQCNLWTLGNVMYEQYSQYMKYRYGDNIIEELTKVEKQDDEYYLKFYQQSILNLVYKFPELAEIVINTDTGELKDSNDIFKQENSIEKQFYTFSTTYKQDLDTISKALNSDYIEYSRY